MHTSKQLLTEVVTALNNASTAIKVCCVILRSIPNKRITAKLAKLKDISAALDEIVNELNTPPPVIAVPGVSDEET